MRRATVAIIGVAFAVMGLVGLKVPQDQLLGTEAVATGPVDPSAGAAPSTSVPPSSAPSGPADAPSAGATDPPPDPSPEPAPASSEAAPPPETRTFAGSRERAAEFGFVQVEITMVGSELTEVTMLEVTSRPNGAAREAPPILIQEALVAQSADIGNVSQATYTSDAFKASLRYALDQA